MSPAVAIVGMACRYPDARSPAELWESALARRRAFRSLPPERLRVEDYRAEAAGEADATYVTMAAVLSGYEFDRVRHRVAAASFRAADVAHWLALDVADEALRDAGFADGERLPREATGVLVGNSLTGEFSRAGALRVRAPYVRRVVQAELVDAGLPAELRGALLERIEARYKAPFAPPDDETLAGALSNTIAGRICNRFDLRGGGYTVDGACAASLLAVTNACSALAAGDLDVALAGGVDLSLDPFELVGFARTGALAREKMRVYDAQSAGFWPGEGAGFVVLMRHDDALAMGLRPYAVVRGWGVSSDGAGGLTRPESKGQMLALSRAYARAGYGVDTVAYFEGHGTGTAVGDAAELRALSLARRQADQHAPPAAIGSIKANIGHTKAAAGVAGLIKAAMAVRTQVIPPTTGCDSPHPEFGGDAPALRVAADAEPWPEGRPLRAGVSAMGFGGINAHVTLEGADPARRQGLTARERAMAAPQDVELLLFGAPDVEALASTLRSAAEASAWMSWAELGDFAAALAAQLDRPRARAAILASRPDELRRQVATLLAWLAEGRREATDAAQGLFFGCPSGAPRIGFLFPGQGAPVYRDGGALARRFEPARRLYEDHPLPAASTPAATDAAQPAIALASLAASSFLERLGVRANLAIGHSLGELVALGWSGVVDPASLMRIARARGDLFAKHGRAPGAMLVVAADAQAVEPLLPSDGSVVIAGFNATRQTVVSGVREAVEKVNERAVARGLSTVRLPVSHAFHSPLMAEAASAFAAWLAGETFGRPAREIVSTVTGAALDPGQDINDLLVRQVTAPVRFIEAARAAAGRADLFFEVGPGGALSALMHEFTAAPVLAIDAGGPSLRGFLSAVAAAFARGADVDAKALFAGRLVRPFDPRRRPQFLANPCESVPAVDRPAASAPARPPEPPVHEASPPLADADAAPLDVITRLVTVRTELPADALHPESRLLSDLHLTSIAVGQLMTEAAKQLGLPPAQTPLEYADATLRQIAQALEARRQGGSDDPAPLDPPGVDDWVRAFRVEWTTRPAPAASPALACPPLRVLAPEGHALAGAIRERLSAVPSNRVAPPEGVVVCLPPELDEGSIALLLDAARLCRTLEGRPHFVLVHEGVGAAFARTLHLEMPHVAVVVLELPQAHPNAAAWVLSEAAAAAGFREARYDAFGACREPVLRCLEALEPSGGPPLGRGDVLLVTGGGKGITAECALAVARRTGAKLAIVGRSRPNEDHELAANLGRMAAQGVEARYAAADVVDAAAVRAAVRELTDALGPVTALLHGAGLNRPTPLGQLRPGPFAQTLAVKVDGLRNVLAALAPERLRALVTFGSIIGRIGMHGEADYAVANEWLTSLTERFAAEHPACKCLAVEWSVWSGVGMGERLGREGDLRRLGVTPIAPEPGAAMLIELLEAKNTPPSVVVTGRFGRPPTVTVDRRELPLLRFLETPRVYTPGVELVAESELSVEADPYLGDHVVSGEPLLPAVMGLEAMAQVAAALAEATTAPAFEDVAFLRPVVVPSGGKLRIRVAALAEGDGRVRAVLRSESTGFQVDHFRATCRFDRAGLAPEPSVDPRPDGLPSVGPRPDGLPSVELDPARDLYETLLFQRGRFRRLAGYRRLSSTACAAELAPGRRDDWFGRFLPSALVLGDPGARDAAMHAIQACIPHERLLPVGIDALVRGATPGLVEPTFVSAIERARNDDVFTYDVDVRGPKGELLERWVGLRLCLLRGEMRANRWPEPLLGPYLERRVRDFAPDVAIAVAVDRDDRSSHAVRAEGAVRRVVGANVALVHGPDGRVGLADGRGTLSVAHAGEVTMAVFGDAPVGCALELVTERPASVWLELLGAEHFALAELVAQGAREELSAAATRVRAAVGAFERSGGAAALRLQTLADDGAASFTSGPRFAMTTVALTRAGQRLAVALSTEASRASV